MLSFVVNRGVHQAVTGSSVRSSTEFELAREKLLVAIESR